MTVHIDQAPRNVSQLSEFRNFNGSRWCQEIKGEPTSSNLFSCGWAATNWVMFPFVIHSDTMANRFR